MELEFRFRWGSQKSEPKIGIPNQGDTIVVYFKSVVGSWEKEANWILTILVKIKGADLRRFDKHIKRATLWTGEYPPVMIFTFLWYKRH
jgi:hypothetical protein